VLELSAYIYREEAGQKALELLQPICFKLLTDLAVGSAMIENLSSSSRLLDYLMPRLALPSANQYHLFPKKKGTTVQTMRSYMVQTNLQISRSRWHRNRITKHACCFQDSLYSFLSTETFFPQKTVRITFRVSTSKKTVRITLRVSMKFISRVCFPYKKSMAIFHYLPITEHAL
jgi:hypothetical protein